MIGYGLISMFKKRVLEGVLIGVGMLSIFVVVVIALCIYVFNTMISLDVGLPLRIALCFVPIGFATFITSKILHEILDLGIIANSIASSEYTIDFFKEHLRKSLTKHCRQIRFSVENSSYPLCYYSQEKFLKNYVGRQRR